MWRKTIGKLDPICDHVVTNFTSLCLTPSGVGLKSAPLRRCAGSTSRGLTGLVGGQDYPDHSCGLNSRLFCQRFWSNDTDCDRFRRYTFVLGLTLRSLIASEGNLSRKHKNANCFLSADGSPSLRTSACLNAGIVQMWATHSGLLSPDLSKQSEDSKGGSNSLDCSWPPNQSYAEPSIPF